ncbi:unnamed protein product [Moneuplotes crassus]|uniref:DNA topoisomerase n=1 Tax=Euplotes crassus TaxID=5936 RepID=A0AAD1Y3S2_EUPCR|nr:unnamed protein product [Moneuplotes crassus]
MEQTKKSKQGNATAKSKKNLGPNQTSSTKPTSTSAKKPIEEEKKAKSLLKKQALGDQRAGSYNQAEEDKQDLDSSWSDSDEGFETQESSDFEDLYITEEEKIQWENNHYALIDRLKLISRRKGFINISMVAEKPKVARTIYNILSQEGTGHFESSYNGHTVLQFKAKYKGMIANFNILSVYGHVYEHDFKESQRLRRQKVPLETFDAEVINNKLARGNKSHFGRRRAPNMRRLEEHLCCYLDQSDMIVLWFDNDTSGENICFQIMMMLENYRFYRDNPYSTTRYNPDNIMRAKFSSLSRRAIWNAFNKLSAHPDENLALAHDLRSEIDLRLGISFSHLLSRELEEFLNIGREFTTSYGPCQFPTFWFAYQRQAKIDRASTKPYWLPIITVETQGGAEIELEFKDKKFETREGARDYLLKAKTQNSVQVTKIEHETEELEKPKPMNTVDLLSSASNEFGYTVDFTKRCAQRLYTDGLISYPRTHSRAYDADYEVDKVLEMLERNSDFEEAASKLRTSFDMVTVREGKIQEHPPITPVHNVGGKRYLEEDSPEWKLYYYIVNHFFATLSHNPVLKTVTSEFKFGEETLEAEFSNIVDQGYLEYLPLTEKEKKMLSISEASLGKKKQYKVKSFKLQKRFPPTKELLSEPELIQKMEMHKIGTDGTIPTHIDTIIKRRYVTVQEGKDGVRRFLPTKRGIALAEGFNEIDPDLFEPKVRAEIESQWKQVAHGEIGYEEALEDSKKNFRGKLVHFMSNIDILRNKLSANIDQIKEECKELAEKEKQEREEIRRRRIEGRDEDTSENEDEAMSEEPKFLGGTIKLIKDKEKSLGLSINTIADLHKIPADHRRGDEYLLYEEEISTQAGTDFGD